MATIFDAAKYILHQTGKMSTWKLQKLCYYSQAWSLAWTEKEIFSEDFEAWMNGPVCPSLFYAHQGKYTITENDLNTGNPDNLTEDQKETIDIVIKVYGIKDPYDLRELTHSEPPWKNARKGLKDTEYSHEIITKSAMGEYYGSL